MNELERVVENLEDNIDDCLESTPNIYGFRKMANEGESHDLNFMMTI